MIEQGVAWIWTALQTASPIAAAICFLAMLKAWRDLADEKEERRALQKQVDNLLERTLKGLGDVTVAVNASTSMAESSRNAMHLLRDAVRDAVAGFARRGRVSDE